VTELEFHPLADLFPLIEANGVRDPIWKCQGKILDGRNRYRAAAAAGIQLRADQIIAFVISKNLRRRHADGRIGGGE
jgi:hypothetical protein